MVSALLLAAVFAVPQETASGSEIGTAFEDPAPPVVHHLEEVAPPGARTHSALTRHAPPKALAPDAVTRDWPGFLGPNRDGRSDETRLAKTFPPEGPPLVWEVERGRGYASPVVSTGVASGLAGGRLVFTHRIAEETHVDGLDAETGERFWRFSLETEFRPRYIEDDGPRSTPALADGRVVVHTVDGKLFCLELATGRVIWRRDLALELGVGDDFFGVVSSPLVAGGLVFQNVGAPGGPTVAAFDLETGRMVWGAGEEWGPSCASPVLATVHGKERLLVMAGGESRPPVGGLMVLDPATGVVDSTYDFRSRTYESVNASCPIVDGNRVFLTASYGVGSAMLALDEEGGYEELWTNRHVGIQFSNPIFRDGRVYVVDGVSGRAGAVIAIDPSTGEELSRTDLSWEQTVLQQEGSEKTFTVSLGEGSLLLADDDFLCLGDRGLLAWLREPAPGEELEVLSRAWLFDAQESWTPLVLSRGLLYVCQNAPERPSRAGASPRRLLCYDLRASSE